MKKKNTKAMITRILACVLLVATLGLSLASCAAKDKVKDAAGKAWDTAVDGAEKIVDKAKDNMTFEQTSGASYVRILSDMELDEPAAPTYAGTLTAQDFVGNWTNKNGKDALYVQGKELVGSIVSVTGATTIDNYWSVEPGDKPVVAIDKNNSILSVVLPTGYTDVATWAAAATDFSVTVTPVMERTLQAIVSPESAPDKSVTWSVSSTEEGVDASEYIRLLTYWGAAENKVTVVALKPFAGHEFKIRCTTVVGGFTAECKVAYEGRPSYMNFHLVNEDGTETYIPGVETFASSSVQNVKLVLGNAFRDVGDNFGRYEIVSTGYSGKFSYYLHSGSGANTGGLLPDVFISCKDDSYFNAKGESFSSDELDFQFKAKNFFSASLVDGCLKVVVYQRFIVRGEISGDGSYGFYQSSSVDPIVFYVTVKDTVSGIEHTLRFKIADVTSVALSESTLTF